MSVLGTHFTAGIMSSIYEEKGLITSKNPRNHMNSLEMPIFTGKAARIINFTFYNGRKFEYKKHLAEYIST